MPPSLTVQTCTTSPGPNATVVEQCTAASAAGVRTGEAHTLAGTPVVPFVDKLYVRFASGNATSPFVVLVALGPLREIGATCGLPSTGVRRVPIY